jgi:hypothetical protein
MQELSGASAPVQTFMAAWRAIRGDRLVPRKVDFDPISVPRLLPNLWIYRYDPQADDFTCTLAGEAVNKSWGGSIRGKRLREVVGDANHPRALSRWRAIIETPLVQYGRVRTDRPAHDDGLVEAERLILPFAGADDAIRDVIGLSLYSYSQTNHALTPPVWDDVVQIPCVEIPPLATS